MTNRSMHFHRFSNTYRAVAAARCLGKIKLYEALVPFSSDTHCKFLAQNVEYQLRRYYEIKESDVLESWNKRLAASSC